jgi:5-oxoprolinase (ATP-hydrolysing)
MEGGQDGAKGQNLIWKRNAVGTLEMISLGGKAVVTLDKGEVIKICTPGGGGWGSPRENEIGNLS